MAWTSHPLRDQPLSRSLALVGLIAGAAVLFGLSFTSLFVGLFSAAVLILSMADYLLPTRYALDERGFRISRTGRSRITSWQSIARVEPRPDGVFVSPFPSPSRLDPFRGAFLRRKDRPEQVLAFARAAAERPRLPSQGEGL